MVPKTRIPPKAGPPSAIRMPSTAREWVQIMVQVIARAEKLKDPRLNGIRAAHAAGQSEAYLRRLGVVCDADIDREFPDD